MPEALAMGTRMEQQSEFFPRASRAGCRYPEDMADSLHRLSSAAQDLQVLIPCRNRTLLLQGEFCITLYGDADRSIVTAPRYWDRLRSALPTGTEGFKGS